MSQQETRSGTDRARPKGTASKARPTEVQIAARAYEIFLNRGAEHGFDIEDWLRAERELAGQN